MNGRNPTFEREGGPGVTASSHTLTTDPNGIYQGSTATASAELDLGNLGLPVLHGSTITFGDNSRTNASPMGYQSFIYNGAAPIAYGLSGTLTFENSSASSSDGKLAGEVAYQAFIGIYDADLFPHFTTADDLFNGNPAFGNCGESGLLASSGTVRGTTPGGAFSSATVSTSACGGGQFMLTPGKEYVALANIAVFANRGGYADFSHTFITNLDPTLGAATLDALRENTAFGLDAVPEPAAWALMIVGFGLAGASLRGRRRLPA